MISMQEFIILWLASKGLLVVPLLSGEISKNALICLNLPQLSIMLTIGDTAMLVFLADKAYKYFMEIRKQDPQPHPFQIRREHWQHIFFLLLYIMLSATILRMIHAIDGQCLLT